MTGARARIFGIAQKELRDYRHNRFVVATMAYLPLLFVVLPTIQLLLVKTAETGSKFSARIGISLLYMLMIPAMVPAGVAAYSVVGEREQGTLEPVLSTPIRPEEFLVGKALAVAVPTLAISYAVFGIFCGIVAIFAKPGVATAVFTGPHLLVQLLFTPLLAGWSIWAGIAISTRSVDVRAAQQLAVVSSFPPLGIVALMSFNVITPSFSLALGLAAALAVVDALGWRMVAAMFDRERLVTGHRGERRRKRTPRRDGTPDAAGEPDAHEATLTLTRRAPFVAARFRREEFDVILDDEIVGEIGDGATLEVPVAAGRHTLRVEVGRYASRTAAFDVEGDRVASFRCHAGRPWPIMLASFAVPRLALALRHA